MPVLDFATALRGAAEHYEPPRVLVGVNKFLRVFTASFQVSNKKVSGPLNLMNIKSNIISC